MDKLQVGQAALAGFRMIFGRFGTAVRIAWVPLLVIVIVQIVMVAVLAPEYRAMTAAAKTTGGAGTEAPADMLVGLLWQTMATVGWKAAIVGAFYLLAIIMLTTGWLQQALRGDAIGNSIGYLRFGRRELKMLGAALLFGPLFGVINVLSMGMAVGIGFVSPIPAMVVALPVYLVIYLVALRLAMIFPMIAVGEPMSWRTAWRMTKGNSWRLFGAYFLAGLLWSVLSLVVNIGIVATGSAAAFFAPNSLSLTLAIPLIAQVIVVVLGTLIMLGTLAEAYRQLGGPGIGVPEETLAVFDDA